VNTKTIGSSSLPAPRRLRRPALGGGGVGLLEGTGPRFGPGFVGDLLEGVRAIGDELGWARRTDT